MPIVLQVAALGKSGVSVGYFDSEENAARAYDKAAIGLLGRTASRAILNFPLEEYDNETIPDLMGKSREEVKSTLKNERAKVRAATGTAAPIPAAPIPGSILLFC